MERRTYTVSEVAQVLSISLAHAYRMAKSGEIPTFRLGRKILVSSEALDQLLSANAPDVEPIPA